ncbi:hypothetical protein ACI1US_01672 [Leucobacter sp. BZR 635]
MAGLNNDGLCRAKIGSSIVGVGVLRRRLRNYGYTYYVSHEIRLSDAAANPPERARESGSETQRTQLPARQREIMGS